MGYVPNYWAANLRKQRTGMIGVVVPRLTDTVMAMFYEAVLDECSARDLHATVVTTNAVTQTELERGRSLVAQRADGLILTTARLDNADPLRFELRELGVHYTLAMRTDGESPSAVTDDVEGGRLATSYLIEHGHRRIAFLGGPPYASNSQYRLAGYRNALHDAGIEPSPELVLTSNFSFSAGNRALARLVALADVPTAVVAASDDLAVGLSEAARRAGLGLPDDLSIVGFNDSPLAARLAVPLTTIATPFRSIARDALDLVLADPESVRGEVRISAPSLVERESVTRAP